MRRRDFIKAIAGSAAARPRGRSRRARSSRASARGGRRNSLAFSRDFDKNVHKLVLKA
jgi:hypothetical protein